MSGVDLDWLRACMKAPGGVGDLGTITLAKIVLELEAGRKLRDAVGRQPFHGHWRLGSNCADCRAMEPIRVALQDYDDATKAVTP